MLSVKPVARPQRPYSIKEFNDEVAQLLGRAFAPQVMVMGELGAPSFTKSNYGEMLFFSLHDGEESLACVSYGKSFKALCSDVNPITGEVSGGRAGLDALFASPRRVICMGTVVTYRKKGQSKYQLLVSSITPTAERSARRLELERIEKRLQSLGCFDSSRKRPIPKNPSKVALVTAKGGAVIHDFLRTAQTRGIGATIKLYPVRVQGEKAGPEMAKAVTAAGRSGCEVVVLIRGGGSEDDLACFNDERLAVAVFECKVPVVAGIGHEVDFTFADRIADLRSSTPTRAAQDLWEERSTIYQRLLSLHQRADTRVFDLFFHAREMLARFESSLKAQNPISRNEQRTAELKVLKGRLDRATAGLLQSLDATAKVYNERLQHAFYRLLSGFAGELASTGKSLSFAARTFATSYATKLKELSLRLEAFNPMGPVDRGFALVRKENGEYAQSASDLKKGDVVELVFKDGRVLAVTVGQGVFKRTSAES